MKAKEIMTTDVHCCQLEQTLHEAAQTMWEQDCGCLPVTDPVEGDRVVAMLTDRDIAMGAYLNGHSLRDIRVRHVMSKGLRTCQADDDIATVEKTMSEAQIRRIPVVDDQGRLLGLITLGKLARIAADGGSKKANVSEAEVGQTLAAICQPSRA